MKKMSKMIGLLVALIVFATTCVPAFASNSSDSLPTTDFDMVEVGSDNESQWVPSDSGGPSRSTFIGNAGTSRLDYMPSGRSFAWSINPNTSEPLYFSGTITIYTASNHQYKGTLYISGAGNGKASGVAAIGGFTLTRNTNYIAKYAGTAIAVSSTYSIVSGAQISFRYS